MHRKLIRIGEDNTGPHYGLNLGGTIFPVSDRDADTRRVGEGSQISFVTTREGEITIAEPSPVIGCEREKV